MDCSRFIALTLPFLLPFVGIALSLDCKPTQYLWTNGQMDKCCDMCPPGTYLSNQDETTCELDCRTCKGERYANTYHRGSCSICSDCDKENMEFVSRCNKTHNAVCRCKPGYMCEDKECNYCTASPTTTAPPATTHRTTVSTVPKHEEHPTTSPKPIQDTVWFLIIICLLCVGIALVIVTKIKPLLNWFTHNKSYCLDRKPVSVPASMHYTQEEEDEACVPVQEMFGKWDQPIEV